MLNLRYSTRTAKIAVVGTAIGDIYLWHIKS
jgi:hypothetical protein